MATDSEQLSASIQEISRQVALASATSSSAVEEAWTTTEVRDLAEASQKIGEVVNLINDIASQTNLLALNAAIEAAQVWGEYRGCFEFSLARAPCPLEVPEPETVIG